ncbi:TadE/TadG family type IV pilus assembly protein [Actibacterium pelagium]|uniref:Flp pilus assembly protein TadG n=1 Tax=Actibacterium pelagium TaxID=2029103 RepID=A0A917EI46_9RHOB|nr:hypothetical protein [Actibacterium pelagium]GGE38520.1 hypothetical protein GCM10011517_02890 [Actibacterium pelagium]
MRLPDASARRTLKKFWREEDGTASVDGLIWVMFFTTLLVFILDASIMFMNNVEVRRVTQDGSRLYVRGGFDGEADPIAALDLWVENNLSDLSPNVNATSSLNASNQLSTVVTYPASDTDLTGLVNVLSNFNIEVLVVNQKAVL